MAGVERGGSLGSANIGNYIGFIGVILSLMGVVLSVYSLSSGEKAIWLGVSGWVAAVLIGILLIIPILKLLSELSAVHDKNYELLVKSNDLQNANNKMMEIDAYVISKTVRHTAAAKRDKKMAETTASFEAEVILQREGA
ncbi:MULTISPECIES: hypothetical protein [unclassified Pseudomonas]|uniref:hypothetical protein n=1 Tax=unclassified Pseudomonas TaxID=196821 RepID=UPI000A1F32B4|nr:MULTISPECIES: hypothetical protein [unclassified Pseudomonas]